MSGIEQILELIKKYTENGAVYADQLCAELADRTLFVILSESLSEDLATGSLVVKFLFQIEGVLSVALVATSQEIVESWAKSRGVAAEFAEMNGSDLCASLPRGTALRINPLDKFTALISPQMVVKITAFGASNRVSPVVKPEQNKIQKHLEALSQAPVLVPNTSTTDQQQRVSPLSRHIPRGHPTMFVAAPTPAQKPSSELINNSRPRNYTSSNLKKIIRNPGSTG